MSDIIQDYKSNYETLKARADALNKELSRVNSDILKTLTSLAFEIWKIKIGVLVTIRDETYQVSSIEIRPYYSADDIIRHKPWCKGYPIKKNGEPSKAERHLYDDWKVIEDTP